VRMIAGNNGVGFTRANLGAHGLPYNAEG